MSNGVLKLLKAMALIENQSSERINQKIERNSEFGNQEALRKGRIKAEKNPSRYLKRCSNKPNLNQKTQYGTIIEWTRWKSLFLEKCWVQQNRLKSHNYKVKKTKSSGKIT